MDDYKLYELQCVKGKISSIILRSIYNIGFYIFNRFKF